MATLIFFSILHFYNKQKKFVYLFGITTYILAFQLGIALHFFHYDKNKENHYSNFIENNEKVLVEAIVENRIKSSKNNAKFTVQIKKINNHNVYGKTIVYIPKEDSINLKPGLHFLVITNLVPVKNNLNPYQFNYAKYIEKQNIFHQIFTSKKDLKLNYQEKNSGYYLNEIRENLINSFKNHNFSQKTQSIINALLFGQRIDLDKETIESYSNAGVIHILAISGLHVGILFLILSFICTPLNHFKKGKNVGLIIILGTLWLFAFLSGLSPSVTRAVLMFSILAIGKHFNRQTTTINTVAVSALILLCFNPNYIFDVGFQMSYAALISIILLHPFFKYFHLSKNKIIKYVVDILLVSTAAQIGVLPLSIYYFNQFPTLFLVANLIVIPLTFLILALGIATLLLNYISTWLAFFFGLFLSKSIEGLNFFINWISSFESFLIKNISFTFLLCFVSYIVIFMFLFTLYNPKIKNLKYVLISIFLLQITYITIKFKENNTDECIVFASKNSLITIKEQEKIIAFTNDPEENSDNISQYKKGSFAEDVSILPLDNVLLFNKTKVLIVDSLATYKISQKPNIIILTQGTRVNLERVIKITKPDLIIADNSNSKYKVENWKATCLKEKVPFHSTYEMGPYTIRK